MKKWMMPVMAMVFVGLLIGGFYTVSSLSGAIVKGYPEMTVTTKQEQLRDYFERVKKSSQSRFAFGEEAEGSSDMAGATEESSAKSSNVSTTNVQVEGVDEADTVKLNEDYIYMVSDQKVSIFDIRDPDNMVQAGDISFGSERYPVQLFLTEDYLVVLNQNYFYQGQPVLRSDEGYKWAPYDGLAVASIYSLEDPENPKLVREVGAEGQLSSARMTDNTIYFISNLYSRMWAFEENEEVELRPFNYDSEKGEDPEAIDYDKITILPDTLEGGYTLISAISLEDLNESQLSTEGYLGSSEQFYMSTESIYLTTTVYSEEGADSDETTDSMFWNSGVRDTDVYKFDFEGTDVELVGSHRLEGHLLNQFSMDEYDNHFRVVTTEGDSWNESKPSENHLFILDDEMNRVGELKGLAKTERIYSARFMGDKAYMVTFKETDPLFVFDLSDPTKPAVLGELKIPGFSNYLHPIDETHLLGIGYETEMVTFPGSKEPSLVTGAMKMSLFDVSDFSNPKEQDVEIIGGYGSYSPAQYDHKALMIHQEKGYYGFPVTLYSGKAGGNVTYEGDGANIYQVSPEQGITQVASLMNDKVEGQQYEEWNYAIQRLVYVDDTLFTLANRRISSYDFNTFERKQVLDY